MAHIVGVPKRDPCQKCSLPVFLAERLTIGKRVYHRTCLKCARCNSQLTPGSFYETETDEEYCCETCPDEEKSLPTTSSTAIDFPPVKRGELNRSSIADRLAFFENDGKKVLQKSLSDEEKSQSLKKMSEAAVQSSNHVIYKGNPNLMEFMNNHLTMMTAADELDSSSKRSSRRNSTSSISSSDSNTSTNSSSNEISNDLNSGNFPKQDEESISEKVPDLPKEPPPIEKTETELPAEHHDNVPSYENEKITVSNDLVTTSPLTTAISIKENINIESASAEEAIVSQESFTDDRINSNVENHFTKDIHENEEMMGKPVADPIDNSKALSNEENFTKTKNQEIIDPLNSDSICPSEIQLSSVVRARLHQFENIANKPLDSSISSVRKYSSSSNTKNSSDKTDNKSKINQQQEDKANESEQTDMPAENPSQNEVPDFVVDDKKPENKEESLENSIENKISSKDKIELESCVSESSKDDENEPRKSTDTKVINPSLSKENGSSSIGTSNTNSIENKLPEKKLYPEKGRNAMTLPASKLKNLKNYPTDLNPFGSSEEEDAEEKKDDDKEMLLKSKSEKLKEKRKSLNPFESSDEEGGRKAETAKETPKRMKPPRPPPPKKRISTNPFGSDTEDEADKNNTNVNGSSSMTPKKTPIPTPRNRSTSQNPTPEPTPRATRQNNAATSPSYLNTSDYYGSNSSLVVTPNTSLTRDGETRSSSRSLTSSIGSGTTKARKSKKAPAPPPPPASTKTSKELLVSTTSSLGDSESKKSSPNSSIPTTPIPSRKKRPAPPPPSLNSSPAINKESKNDQEFYQEKNTKSDLLVPAKETESKHENTSEIIETGENIEVEKLSDEEKVILANKLIDEPSSMEENGIKRRLISVDASLLDETSKNEDKSNSSESKASTNAIFRRTLVAPKIDDELETSRKSTSSLVIDESRHDRQLEKLKDNKEAKNRNRQSQIFMSSQQHSIHPTEENDPLFNKSSHGKWKRRKGPAPALPIPPKKVLQMLPLQEIRHELEIIEVQQQGLEKQGVMLEKMIRERCEGPAGMENPLGDGSDNANSTTQNSKEVEDLILQLFELVNEKNELFRRQAELMYLRRQHRLEQEQADLEYEIRVLMAQPERNKTDSDKAREEALIARLVEVVQLRNEVIESLEMDRLREAEEDLSIKQRLELHSAKRDEELCKQTPTKLSKKEKKKQKELKKLGKSKKLDADKDADESELSSEKQKKKKKKKFLF